MKTSKQVAKIVKQITNTFTELNGTSFVGIREYTNGSGETANHVINVGFNYGNAVEKDIKALKALTRSDFEVMAKNLNLTIPEKVEFYANEMIVNFEKNKDSKTASVASQAQIDAYIHITPGIKMHIESGEIHIYALAVSKKVLVKGTYKDVNHGQKWHIENEIKNYCNFSTAKYRNFKVVPEKFTTVNISGESYTIK